MNYEIIDVKLDNVKYPIVIGDKSKELILDLLERKTKNSKILIVADKFFQYTLCQDIETILKDSGYTIYTFYMRAGKGNKTISEVLKIYGILEENNLARDSTLIAIGGGVIGDLAGFVASTWLRGMNLVHMPTTLMAMVDSSVGGKVAINYRQTINAIGNYYHPIGNIMDLTIIDSLSYRDYISGLAESIKCAIISDTDLFEYMSKNRKYILEKEYQHMRYIIMKTIEIKIKHVDGDLREGGKRLLLNYGHTLGHAIEISTEKNHQEQLRHGEGVSIGIIAVAYIATRFLKFSPSLYDKYKKILLDYDLPVSISASKLGFTRDILLLKCLKNVKKDKKRLNNGIRIVLSDSIGSAKVYENIPFGLIKDAFEHVIKE